MPERDMFAGSILSGKQRTEANPTVRTENYLRVTPIRSGDSVIVHEWF